MRSLTCLTAAALLLASCDCGTPSNVVGAQPEAHVLEPTAQDGEEWVLDFGSVRAGISYTGRVVIENRGRNAWNVSDVVLRADSALSLALGDFAPPVPASLDTSLTLVVTVVWTPRQKETMEGRVDVFSDDPTRPRITIRVVGQAEAPSIRVCEKVQGQSPRCEDPALSPGLAIDFGLLRLTDPAAERVLVVQNTLTLDLHVASAKLAADASSEFGVGTPSSTTIAPGTSAEVRLTYKPYDGGFDDTVLEIASDDPRRPLVLVALHGGGRAPRVCVEPAALAFGDVAQLTPVPGEVTITSCGTTPLSLASVVIDAGSSSDFAVGAVAAAVLPPGSRVTATVTYTPGGSGQDFGNLRVTSDDPFDPALAVPLSGNGVPTPVCNLEVTPRQVTFGTVPTTGYADRLIVGTNLGQKACALSGWTGPTSPVFAVHSAPLTPKVIQPNGTFTMTVRYTPSAVQADTDALVLQSDDPGEPNLTISLSGNGRAPQPCEFQVTPSAVNFGVVGMGLDKKVVLSVINFGTVDCQLLTISLGASTPPGSFAITRSPQVSGISPVDVPSGHRVDLEVQFKPTAPGRATGSLQLRGGEDLLSSQNLPPVSLEGTGVAPTLCIVPPGLDFGQVPAGAHRDLTFQIQNCGEGALEIRGVYLDTGSSPDFSLENKPALPAMIVAGAPLVIDVRYAPTDATADLGQVMVLTSDPNHRRANVKIKGNAGACTTKLLACSPTVLSFPVTPVGQSSSLGFTCLSVGSQDVRVNSIAFRAGASPDFALSTAAPAAVLAPGQRFRVAVDYTPTAPGNANGSVEVLSDDCQSAVATVSLFAGAKAPDYPKCVPAKTFEPIVKWEWRGSTVAPDSKKVWMTPLVVNLTDDNGDGRIDEEDTPDVVFTTNEGIGLTTQPDWTPPGVLRAIDGRTGASLWNMADPGLALSAACQIAAGDIDGDNKVEIVAVMRFESPTTTTGRTVSYKVGRIMAFENDGSLKWVSEYWRRDSDPVEDDSAISIADLDADGFPEIVLGGSVFDGDGVLKWEGHEGTGNIEHGSAAVVADLDGDGLQEVIGGRTAYAHDGQVLWSYGTADGQAIVVDMEADGTPEVVLRTWTDSIVILDNQGHKKYGPYTLPIPEDVMKTNPCAAPIAAADFDGDGKPELAIPAASILVVMRADGSTLWTYPIQDYVDQCGSSGAAAFDFEGDGKFDVVYHDVNNVWVFRGADGTVMYHTDRFSVTAFETPVIADVDNDGHAEILVVQETGAILRLLGNTTNDWIGTQRIWNQHGYHVTNVLENGSIPRVPQPSWKRVNGWRAAEPRCME